MKVIFKVTIQKQNPVMIPAGYKNDCKSWFYSDRQLAFDKVENIKNAFEVLGFERDWKGSRIDSSRAIFFNINYEIYEINCEEIYLDPENTNTNTNTNTNE